MISAKGKGSFNNYVDKKRGKRVSRKSTLDLVTCKMSTIVHSRGEGVKIRYNLVHVVVE